MRLAQEEPEAFMPLLIRKMLPEPAVPQQNYLNIRIELLESGGSEGTVIGIRSVANLATTDEVCSGWR